MAKRKTVQFPKCDRRFSMPAHRARHVKSTHGSKVAAAASGKKGNKTRKKLDGRTKAGRRKAGRSAAIAGGDVRHLIALLRAHHADLIALRAELDRRIAAMAAAIELLEGAGATPPRLSTGKRGRPVGSGRKSGTLRHAIMQVLRQSSRPMMPKDIAAAVKKSGYKSKSKDLTHSVSNLLTTIKAIKKVGFGLYRV